MAQKGESKREGEQVKSEAAEGVPPKWTVCRNWVKLPFDEYVARGNELIPILVVSAVWDSWKLNYIWAAGEGALREGVCVCVCVCVALIKVHKTAARPDW